MNFPSVCIAVFSLIISANVYAQENLLKNGGFEKDLSSWNGDAASVTPYVVKSGKNSASINGFKNSTWMGIDQVAGLPKKVVAVEFSVWVQSTAIQAGKNPWNAGVVAVEFNDGGTTKVGETQNIVNLTGDSEWKQYKKTMPVPKGARAMRVMLALAEVSGSILFDDVIARPITQEEADKMKAAQDAVSASSAAELKNGDFESGTPVWSGQGELSNTAHSGTYGYLLKGYSAKWVGIDQTISILPATKSIEASAWIKTENLVQGKDPWNGAAFIVEFSDGDGKKLGDAQTVTTVIGTQDWKRYSKTIAVPEGAKKVRTMIAISETTGSFYVDDVVLKALQ